MSNIAIACACCAPGVGLAIVESADSPLVGGIAALVVGALLVPVFRWMMVRQDAMHKENADAAIRREEREDKRAEAFAQQVVALSSIVTELRLLNEHHKQIDQNRKEAVAEILERIDGLPDRIVKKCSGT